MCLQFINLILLFNPVRFMDYVNVFICVFKYTLLCLCSTAHLHMCEKLKCTIKRMRSVNYIKKREKESLQYLLSTRRVPR